VNTLLLANSFEVYSSNMSKDQKVTGPLAIMLLVIALFGGLSGCVGYVGDGGGGVVAVDTGPDVYLFGGGRGYDRGHDVHDYSHRGFVSHSAAHVGGGAHRR
jgi:hypothetical protein